MVELKAMKLLLEHLMSSVVSVGLTGKQAILGQGTTAIQRAIVFLSRAWLVHTDVCVGVEMGALLCQKFRAAVG